MGLEVPHGKHKRDSGSAARQKTQPGWDRGSAEVGENVTRTMEELENTTEAVKVQQDGRAQLGQRKCSRVETQPGQWKCSRMEE